MQQPVVDYAFVGGLREDYFILPSGQAHLGKIGGNAVYAAVGARLWSGRVGIVSRVGSNFPADWLAVIRNHGIHTGGVQVVPEPLDTRTFYAYLSLEERVDTHPELHFARAGLPLPEALRNYATSTEGQEQREDFSPLAVRPEEVPGDYRPARGFHLAPYDFLLHLRLPAWLRQHGVTCLTADPSVRYMQPAFAPQVAEIVGLLDAFLPSEMETREFFGGQIHDLWQALEAFGAMGAACAVIKRGAAGQYVYHAASRRRWHVPAYPAHVVDVTGAGDAYCGGFLVGLERTGDPLEAALYGTVSASLVVEGTGALFALARPPSMARERLDAVRAAVATV
jgi:sugar/nucleoside kinase (ribokinase family)